MSQIVTVCQKYTCICYPGSKLKEMFLTLLYTFKKEKSIWNYLELLWRKTFKVKKISRDKTMWAPIGLSCRLIDMSHYPVLYG